MKILIIGPGFAGRQYERVFLYLAAKKGIKLQLAYAGQRQRPAISYYYTHVPTAVTEFRPDIVVVSVNDLSHNEILSKLAGFKGFVICEKPLAVPGDDWSAVCRALLDARGFALNLIERYSETSKRLKNIVSERKWSLVRSSFYWGKDRLNDYRPTCGVTSEVIHALDLVEWICAPGEILQLQDAIGIGSDFSISGDNVPDTVLLTATLGEAPVAGYSSFVNIQRQRTVDFSFCDPENQIFHARILYDTPGWGDDHLRIWTRNAEGRERQEDEWRVSPQDVEMKSLHKLSLLCDDVLRVVTGNPPLQPFADLKNAMHLQRLLDAISRKINALPVSRYIRGNMRTLIPENADSEILG